MSTLMTRLTEAEIDDYIAWKTEPCVASDEQIEAMWKAQSPVAAEACTEVGAETDWTPAQMQYLRVIAYIGSPLLVVGVIALSALYLH